MEQGALYKASCYLRFIKAIFPLLLYDGEPSVPNEIVSQLPSSHLFIHRVPTKLSNGIVSHGENYRWLQLLFFRSYRPASPSAVPVARRTQCRPWFPLVLLLMRLPKAPSFTGSFPEPCPAPVHAGNPARLWNHLHISAIVCLCCCRFCLLLLSPDVPQHLGGIVFCPIPQDSEDNPKYFTGYHDQRLHLLERVFRSGCVIQVQFLEFRRMGNSRLCCLEQPIPEPLASPCG